mgnify:CR=1 FL=1
MTAIMIIDVTITIKFIYSICKSGNEFGKISSEFSNFQEITDDKSSLVFCRIRRIMKTFRTSRTLHLITNRNTTMIVGVFVTLLNAAYFGGEVLLPHF